MISIGEWITKLIEIVIGGSTSDTGPVKDDRHPPR